MSSIFYSPVPILVLTLNTFVNYTLEQCRYIVMYKGRCTSSFRSYCLSNKACTVCQFVRNRIYGFYWNQSRHNKLHHNLHYCTVCSYPQSTYVCRVQSSVWRLPKYWPPTPYPPGECVLPLHQRRGSTHLPGGGRGGVNSLEDARVRSFSRLKKKPGIFRKCPAFSKVSRLFNHTGYTQYYLKSRACFNTSRR